jgi:phosphatidylserine/phosphatidylglycerophosphate/cardiolipin synthase-like enzyme
MWFGFSALLFVGCMGIFRNGDPTEDEPLISVNPSKTPILMGGANASSQTSITLPSPLAAYSSHLSNLDLYFTNPEHPLSLQETGGVDGPLVQAIDNTTLSIDLAMYSISLDNVAAALIRAYDRGVRVRIVMESDNLDRRVPQKLMAAGIAIKGDRREGLMHNKFMVLDNSIVWTGSLNYTDTGVYEDNNALIRIDSDEMAADYTSEFEEMYIADVFEAEGSTETLHPRFGTEDVFMEVYFSPDDHPQEALLEIIRNAQQSINILAFAFTSDLLGEAIRQRAADGVLVHGVMDKVQAEIGLGDESLAFRQAGLDIRFGGQTGLMHHKTIIVDHEIVVVGSYNFTNSAEETNDENLIIIMDPSVADSFMTEFNRIFLLANEL